MQGNAAHGSARRGSGCSSTGAYIRFQDAAAERTRPVPEVAGKYPDAHMFGCILPAYGLYARHVDGLSLEDVSFVLKPGTTDGRDDKVLDDVMSYCAKAINLQVPYINRSVHPKASGDRPER